VRLRRAIGNPASLNIFACLDDDESFLDDDESFSMIRQTVRDSRAGPGAAVIRIAAVR